MAPSTDQSKAASPDATAVKPHASRRGGAEWVHTPSTLTLLWLTISLPLVAWDTGYVLLRPHSMPGGRLHDPVWKPYALYGRVDYVYGWKAYNEHNGFTGAQAIVNVIESLVYQYYLYLVFAYGQVASAPGRPALKRSLSGAVAGVAVLVLFSAALMTLSKTVLYWLNEYCSGFENVGHNDTWSLITLWVIPNGLWIVLPIYMIYESGTEILQGLALAAGGGVPQRNGSS